MEKDTILANVSHLTAEQLFEEIKNGKVTLDELKNTGVLDAIKRTKIRDLKNELDKKEIQDWETVRYSGSETKLSGFINEYPNGNYVNEAKEKIRNLENERREENAAKQVIFDKLRENQNAYFQDEINTFLHKKIISKDELLSLGIPKKVLDQLDAPPPKLELGNTPDFIPSGYTEVYFWGNNGSGKTTALAAMLSSAHQAGYLNMTAGPGYDYMTRLKNIFVDQIGILPPPTRTDKTQYLPFTLKRTEEKNARSISLIELSGEIFQCFYYKNAGLDLPTQTHQDTFDSLSRFLNGENRKIHFFFIDYSKRNRVDDRGYTQGDYLEAASTYFKNNKIFGNTTDAIYVVVTKCDLMNCSSSDYVKFAKEYLEVANFVSFMNTLKDNCQKYSINSGRLTIEPFSLGRVYFNDICDFDPTYASKLVDILFSRIPASKSSILDFFNR